MKKINKDQYYIQLYVYAGVLIAAAIYLLFKSIYETGLIQYLAKKIKAILSLRCWESYNYAL